MEIGASFFRYLELLLSLALFLSLIEEVKYRDFRVHTGLSFDDCALVALLAALVCAPSLLGYASVAIGAAGIVFSLFFILWLDSILFRVFTIELGTGGLGTVVLSALYQELAELSFARRFFAANQAYALLPLFVLLASARAIFSARTLDLSAFGALSLYFAVTFFRARPKSSAWVVGLLAGLLTAFFFRVIARPIGIELLRDRSALLHLHPLALMVGGLGVTKGLARICPLSERSFFRRPSRLRQFLRRRPTPPKKGFRPKEEDLALLSLEPRAPARSPLFGAAQGASIILVTFESMGTDHLAVFTGRGAKVPFLEGLIGTAARSAHHFSVSPNTNNAHVALYASGYSSDRGFPGLSALRRSGYRTIYMSPIKTKNYGLRPILERAGFDFVIDHDDFVPHPLDQGLLSDYALMTEAPALLERHLGPSAEKQPFFLHVHTTNTHIPYRVVDPRRFCRFDVRDDHGRFLSGLEEADWIVSELFSALGESGLARDPVIVVSSDHGQAFGEWRREGLGYQSHGSAVIKEEVNVPLFVQHKNVPKKTVPFSSHFDVLPTALDLVGIAGLGPCYGDSIFCDGREPCLLLWAGHPSRASSSSYGLIRGDNKLMVDLIADRCFEMDYDDRIRREISGEEKDYVATLIHRALGARGLS